MTSKRRSPFNLALLLSLALIVPGCGQASDDNATKEEGVWKVEVAESGFPVHQTLAEPVELKIKVRNADSRTIPDLAITVDSFNYRSTQKGLADPERPVWVVDSASERFKTADVDTYRFGKLAPGKSLRAVWKVTAVRSGTYTVKYKVSASLSGKAKARLAGGEAAEGAFVVTISRKPGKATDID